MCKEKMEGVLYNTGVGSLMYAMMAMRADIAFVISPNPWPPPMQVRLP